MENREIIIAGAGTGKTTELAKRAKQHSESHLLLTFSKSAVAVAKGRGINASTLHSLCFSVLKRRFKVPTYAETQSIKRGIFSDKILQKKKYELNFETLLHKAIGSMTVEDADFKVAERSDFNLKALKYVQSCDELNLCDFSIMPLLVLKNGLVGSLVKANQLQMLTLLMIDEAQDTSRSMLSLYKKICAKLPLLEESVMVGDMRQAIYEVNGSNLRYLEEFIVEENYRQTYLTVNYRSDKAIVDYVNDIQFESVPERFLTKAEYKSPIKAGEVIKVDLAETSLSNLIEELYGSTLILTRSNNEAKLAHEMLTKDGIPSILLQSNAFKKNMMFASQQPQSIFWKLIANFAAMTIVSNPKYFSLFEGRKKIMLLKMSVFLCHYLNEDIGYETLLEQLAVLEDGSEVEFTSFEKTFRASPPDFCKGVFNDGAEWIDAVWQYCVEGTETDAVMAGTLKKIRDEKIGVPAFLVLKYFALSLEISKDEEFDDGVICSTVHNAKGNAGDNVVVINDSMGLLFADDRLFYVACTRARKKLFLVS